MDNYLKNRVGMSVDTNAIISTLSRKVDIIMNVYDNMCTFKIF